MTLGWAASCGWIPLNPCVKVRLPREAGGKRVARTVLTPEQIGNLARALEEPYQSLVLLLAATGLRISEAIAIKPADIDGNGVLTVSRRIYVGSVDSAKSDQAVRRIPLESKLAERIRAIGAGKEWVFRSEAGTPINPGNALKRYVRPAAASLGITLGGWHDFRHTLSTTLRRAGAHPKVIADILGHRKVNLAMDVYDRTDLADLRKPLESVATGLLPSCYPTEPVA
jgi:integrase